MISPSQPVTLRLSRLAGKSRGRCRYPERLAVFCGVAGATAIIQLGGSIRDAEVIAVADEAGIATLFTGLRLFGH